MKTNLFQNFNKCTEIKTNVFPVSSASPIPITITITTSYHTERVKPTRPPQPPGGYRSPAGGLRVAMPFCVPRVWYTGVVEGVCGPPKTGGKFRQVVRIRVRVRVKVHGSTSILTNALKYKQMHWYHFAVSALTANTVTPSSGNFVTVVLSRSHGLHSVRLVDGAGPVSCAAFNFNVCCCFGNNFAREELFGVIRVSTVPADGSALFKRIPYIGMGPHSYSGSVIVFT